MEADFQPLFDRLREQIASNSDLVGFDLLSLTKPSVRVATQRVPIALMEMGQSRIGGVPDVPADFQWPRWTPTGQSNVEVAQQKNLSGPLPLGFIAQIDLSAIPHIEVLPKSGWLYFFYDRYCEPWGYDPDDRGCCRVMYADCARRELTRAEAPADAYPEHTANLCKVEAWPELTLPDELQVLEYGTSAYDAYQGLGETDGSTIHRLLGHPQPIQNAMELECQLASHGVYPRGGHFQIEEAQVLEAGAADWRLLLQIDTDEDGPGWMWGDVGRIYFWIKEQDLVSLRFDAVWLVFQCC